MDKGVVECDEEKSTLQLLLKNLYWRFLMTEIAKMTEKNISYLFADIKKHVAHPGRIIDERHKVRAGKIFLTLQEYFPDVDFKGYLLRTSHKQRLIKIGFQEEDLEKYGDIKIVDERYEEQCRERDKIWDRYYNEIALKHFGK